MLSLHLGAMIIPSQISSKFIPPNPESNMKMVNIKKEFHVQHAFFSAVFMWQCSCGPELFVTSIAVSESVAPL